MEINVIIVPETSDFINYVLLENKVWINKNLGRPKLSERNAKYVAPYWLDPTTSRGANRIFQILDLIEGDESYEITLGNSYHLKERWAGLEGAQVRRFQYIPLSDFNLRERSDGTLAPISRQLYTSFEKNDNLPTLRRSFFNEFWIGENIDVKKYWKAFYEGEGYQRKYENSDSYILEITFKGKPEEQPLYNYEPIIKTLKAYYNYLKKEYLTEAEYNSEIPLFLQEINRGSEIITVVGGAMLTVMGILLLVEKLRGQQLNNKLTESKIDGQNLSNELTSKKIIGQEIKNIDDAYSLLEKRYPRIYESYRKKEPPKEIKKALHNLLNEGLGKIRISNKPINKKDFDSAKKETEEFDIE